MKRIHLGLFAVISSFIYHHTYAQEQITVGAVVYDAATKSPIEFVNIGFNNGNQGTLSDNQGYFTIRYTDAATKPTDSLLISATGYYDFPIPLSRLKQLLEKRQILFLNPLVISDTVEEIYPNSRKEYLLGYHNPSKNNSAAVTDLIGFGGELATLVSVPPQKTKLEKFHFHITNNTTDSVRLRLNMYTTRAGEIRKNLLKKPIEYLVGSQTGEQIIDVSKENILVDADISLSLELLEIFGDSINFEIATAKERGISFTRPTSHGDWEEHPVTAMAYGLVITTDSSSTFDYLGSINRSEDKNDGFIEGTITASGRPVQGATVGVKGSLTESTTNAEGFYQIEAARGDVLRFEFLTTQVKSILVEDDTTIDIDLEPKYTELDEAVVTAKAREENETITGLGKKKKRSLGFATYSKSIEELPQASTNLATLLVGQFPSLIVNPISGEFQMRGQGSFALSNTPLFVVDDVPQSEVPLWLDVNTIANVGVIPGLAGGVRYGALGRNGVIIINTKVTMNGLEGKKRSVSALARDNDYTENPIPLKQVEQALENLLPFSTATSFEMAKKIYTSNKIKNRGKIPFYLDAFHYFKKWDKEFANSILNTLAEQGKQNTKVLRTLAYTYDQEDEHAKALDVYKQIAYLEPYRAQSYLDLARAYVHTKDYKRAFSLYKLILSDRLISATFNDEVLNIVATEVRHLVTKHKSRVPYEQLPISFYEKAIHLESRIVFDYADAEALFEVQFVNPNNKYSIWSHTAIGNEERLLRELDYGYNTEEVTIEDPESGRWIVNLENLDGKPSYLKYTVYTNYGRPEETKEIKVINLAALKEKVKLSTLEF